MAAGLAAGLAAGWSGGRSWQTELDAAGEKLRQAVERDGTSAAQRLILSQQAQLAARERDNEQARAQVRAWAAKGVVAQAEAEALRRAAPAAGGAETLPASAAEALSGDPIRVVEVNASLEMLVVDAGRARGMKPGMSFSVVHGREPVAEVRVVDVRAAVTGVVIEKVYAGKAPVVGDRLVARKK